MINKILNWIRPKPQYASLKAVTEHVESVSRHYPHLTKGDITMICMTSRCSRTVAREYGISTEDVRKIRRGRYGKPVDFLCRDINLLTEAEIRGIRASRRSDDNICNEYLISLELLEEVRNG